MCGKSLVAIYLCLPELKIGRLSIDMDYSKFGMLHGRKHNRDFVVRFVSSIRELHLGWDATSEPVTYFYRPRSSFHFDTHDPVIQCFGSVVSTYETLHSLPSNSKASQPITGSR